MNVRRQRSLLFTVIAGLLLSASAQQGQLKLDETSLKPVVTRLEATIREAVKGAGGDLETQGVNLVLAFKTGYFKDDPLRASAARGVATALVQDLLVAGDRVAVRAYEFGLWDFQPTDRVTAQITSSSRADPLKTALLAPLLPNTPKAGSLGGHDTERAITELGAAYRDSGDVVIVMLSNVAASQGAPNTPLLGSNAPEYLETLQRFTRVAGTQGGATLELPFKVSVPNAVPTEARLEAIVLVPKVFTGVTLSGGSRSQLLEGATVTASPASSGAAFPWPALLLLLAVIAVGAFLFLRRGAGGALRLEINGQGFDLTGIPNGRAVVTLVGRGYTGQDDGSVIEIDKAPAERFARINREANGVTLESLSSDFTLETIDGLPADEPTRIRYSAAAGDRELIFAGNVISSTGSKRRVSITVLLGLVREG